MSLELTREQYNIIIEELSYLPQFINSQGRYGLLLEIFEGEQQRSLRRMLTRINYEGDVGVFVATLVERLINYGQAEEGVEVLGLLWGYLSNPDYGHVGRTGNKTMDTILTTTSMLPKTHPAVVAADERLNKTREKNASNRLAQDESEDSDGGTSTTQGQQTSEN